LADPDPARILKWLMVAFRKKCLTGEETRLCDVRLFCIYYYY